jgi:hypothetical protein
MADNIAAFRPSYRPTEPDSIFGPDMRRMAIAAVTVTAVLGISLAGWHMLGHAHGGAVPVIEAAAGPVRVKPVNPGGMVVAGATSTAQDQTERLAPPAEQPELAALHAQLRAAHKKIARQQAELEQARMMAPRIAPAPPVQHAAAMAPLDLLSPPVMAPVSLPAILPPSREGKAVQLAAFDSQEAALADWAILQKKLPALLGHRVPEIERADVAGHPIWRLRTGGFASVTSATSFCARLRQLGADCKLAVF